MLKKIEYLQNTNFEHIDIIKVIDQEKQDA